MAQSQITNIRYEGAGFIGDVNFYGVQDTCRWTDTGIYARQDSYWDIVWQYSDEWKGKRCVGWMCTVIQDIQGENIPIYFGNEVLETETYTTTHGLKIVLVEGMVYPVDIKVDRYIFASPPRMKKIVSGYINEPILPYLCKIKYSGKFDEGEVLYQNSDFAIVQRRYYDRTTVEKEILCSQVSSGLSVRDYLISWAETKKGKEIKNWSIKEQIKAIDAMVKFLNGRQATGDLLREFIETAKK